MPDDVVSQVAETAVVSVVGRQHSARPQRAHRARGPEGGRRGHLGGPGDARSASHRGRRRPVVAVDRRCATAVAHRNRLALRRTRRAHPGRGGSAAARSRTAPSPTSRRGRGGLRDVQLLNALAIAQLADVYPEPVAGIADRITRRGAPGAAQRAHRAAPGVRPRPRLSCWPSTPTRSARRCASATDSTWPACSPTPPAPSATTSTPGCAPRPTRCRAAGLPRCAGRCAVRSTRASSSSPARSSWPATPAPNAIPGLILRVAAASATTGLPMAASTLSRLAEHGARTAHAVAAAGAQGPAGDAGRRAAPRWPPSRRWTAPACGAGCSRNGVRCATCRRATSCTSGPSTVISSKPSRGQAHSPPGCRGPTCWCSVRCATTSARAAAATTASSAPSWPPRSAPGSGCGRRTSRLLSKVVRHHLLLPRHRDAHATCRTPRPSRRSSTRSSGDPVLLELLHVLAEADSLATGPGVWGDWKASLIGDLVRRCRLVMAGEPLPHPDPIDPRYLSLAADRRRARRADARRQPAHLQRRR